MDLTKINSTELIFLIHEIRKELNRRKVPRKYVPTHWNLNLNKEAMEKLIEINGLPKWEIDKYNKLKNTQTIFNPEIAKDNIALIHVIETLGIKVRISEKQYNWEKDYERVYCEVYDDWFSEKENENDDHLNDYYEDENEDL